MTANRYFAMRHGESIANRQQLVVSHESNALNGYGLTALAAEQVMQSALTTRLKADTIIVSSDYLRAKETADILRTIICAKAKVKLESRLRERDFGEFELGHINAYDKVWHNDELSICDKTMRIESVGSVLTRGLEVITELDQNFNGKDIVIVGHGDVLQILITYYQGFEPKFHRSIASIKNAKIRRLPSLENIQICDY